MRSRSPDHTGGLAAVGWLGAADATQFVWARRHSLFEESPGRAAGSLAGIGMWLALGVAASAAPLSGRARGLARACGAGNLVLYAIHLRVGKGRVRALPAAVLGAAALLTSRR
ncbi:MAG: hypothetical protein M0T72_03815 [Candidatus Dormibacteraeota bacterium]|nr:hypothetical protein [Candidatus Dormibacteraeota bacterium]